MNTKNNKRRKASQQALERTFVELLQDKPISRITVSEIVNMAGLNRSTFYANYTDVYDLADSIREKLEREVDALYENDTFNRCGVDYLRLFRHIRDNQIVYRTYFKLGYDSAHTVDLATLNADNRLFPDGQLAYHIEFHKAGLNAIIKKWLSTGCMQTPEEMVDILKSEYRCRTELA